jgi:peptidyl-prolyl cis-trans isomerase SurA
MTDTFVHRIGPLVLAACLGAAASAAWAQSAPSTRVSASAGRSLDFIVAVVNAEPITNQDVSNRSRRLLAQGAAQQASPELARQVMESLIVERAQVQMAASVGIRVEDAAVEQAVADVARQNQISVDELTRRLQADGVSLERYRRDLRDEIALMRLREREVDSRVRISEQEIDRYLSERQAAAAAAEPTQIHLAQILIAVPEDSTPEQLSQFQARAEQLRRSLEQGADFAALAKQVSNSPDAQTGGQLGLRSPDRYPALFVQATQGQPVGAVVGPVRSGAGLHVLKVLERKLPGDELSTVVQTRARHILLRPSPRLNEQAARSRLNELRARARAGQSDFGQLAREFSEDGSARTGGDLGWASPGMMVPEFEQAMDALNPGEVSEPVISRFGMHLIEVLERREVPLSDKERRELARRDVRERKTEEALREWLQDVRGRAYVEYREPPQ